MAVLMKMTKLDVPPVPTFETKSYWCYIFECYQIFGGVRSPNNLVVF